MEHDEAIEMMASEKYLLDELRPDLRDAYEEHFFDCTECALDVRLGSAFIEQAKIALPEMRASAAEAQKGNVARVDVEKPIRNQPDQAKRGWFTWLRPSVLVPAFACLLAIVGYQNMVVYPALEKAAVQPRLLPLATVLHDETRGIPPVVVADPVLGSTIAIELPTAVNYDMYKFEFYDSKGKVIWSHTSPGAGSSGDMLSIWLPGGIKQDTYKLVIGGVTTTGEQVPVKSQMFELQTKN